MRKLSGLRRRWHASPCLPLPWTPSGAAPAKRLARRRFIRFEGWGTPLSSTATRASSDGGDWPGRRPECAFIAWLRGARRREMLYLNAAPALSRGLEARGAEFLSSRPLRREGREAGPTARDPRTWRAARPAARV